MQANKIPEWHQAMDTKFSKLIKNDSWPLMPLGPQVNIVSCRRVYWIKHKTNRSLERYKARLVVKDYYHQLHGVDFDDMLCPVIKPTIIRLVIVYHAISHQWQLVDV